MKVTFINWDKYNKRNKDIKRPFWFAFSNNFYTDPDFIDFTDSEKHTFIYMLCETSKNGCFGEIEINETLYSRILGYDVQVLYSTLDKLLKLKVAAVSRQDGGKIATSTQQNRTEQDKTRQNKKEKNIDSAKAKSTDEKSLGSLLFETYSKAFQDRYGVTPVRNMKINSQCKQLGNRLGEDAHEVIKFYLKHNDQWFLKNQHDLGSLVAKAESLHSQWQRGKAVTSVQVRQFEKQSINQDLLDQVLKGEV